jgi:hypothetical protein
LHGRRGTPRAPGSENSGGRQSVSEMQTHNNDSKSRCSGTFTLGPLSSGLHLFSCILFDIACRCAFT